MNATGSAAESAAASLAVHRSNQSNIWCGCWCSIRFNSRAQQPSVDGLAASSVGLAVGSAAASVVACAAASAAVSVASVSECCDQRITWHTRQLGHDERSISNSAYRGLCLCHCLLALQPVLHHSHCGDMRRLRSGEEAVTAEITTGSSDQTDRQSCACHN